MPNFISNETVSKFKKKGIIFRYILVEKWLDIIHYQ